MFDYGVDFFVALNEYEKAGRTKEAWDKHLAPVKKALLDAKALPLKFLETGDFHGVARFARPDGSGHFEIGVRVEGTSAWGCQLQLRTANGNREIWFDADEKPFHARREIRLGERCF